MSIKSTTTAEGGGKKSKRSYRTSQNIRLIRVFLESLLSESFASLGVTVHLTFLACPLILCWPLDLMWGQLRFQSGSSLCSCLQCAQLSELVRFLLWQLQWPFICSMDTVCLADHVDSICSLYSWWGGLGSSSLATLPLGFN